VGVKTTEWWIIQESDALLASPVGSRRVLRRQPDYRRRVIPGRFSHRQQSAPADGRGDDDVPEGRPEGSFALREMISFPYVSSGIATT
jgi:hypothetical protein